MRRGRRKVKKRRWVRKRNGKEEVEIHLAFITFLPGVAGRSLDT